MIVSGHAAGLDYDLARPEGATDGATAALLLHGRGSHKGDLQALGPVLPGDWALLTPQAPWPGADWGYGGGWAWYRYVQEDEVVVETLERSLSLLDDLVGELPDVLGFTPGRLVMGGFSQGGTTSLAFGLGRPGMLTAVFNFSGFLASHVDVGGAAEAPPVYWGHGVRDANIPFHIAERGRARLLAAGVPLVSRDFGIGHWMIPDEVHEAVAMVGTA